MKSIFYLSLIGSVIFSGCVILSKSGNEVQSGIEKVTRPIIFTTYYPYGNYGRKYVNVPPFSPIPDTDGWPEERMERDLKRMRSIGINGVLLAISPSDMADKHRLEMIKAFLHLTSEAKDFHVILFFSPDKKMELGRRNLVTYIENKEITKYNSLYSIDGKILLCFGANVVLVENEKSGYIYHTIPGINVQGPLPLLANQSDNFIKTSLFSFISAGLFDAGENGENKWIIPRKKGKTLAQNFNSVLALKPDRVVIHSWNNCYDGSAIETNTMDSNSTANAFFIELNKLTKLP